ncbi:MAG: DNA recombination protein RmuC [Gammaproteobacteria bacterium]|nr:DNA recombination protein RmuC [Gammaproteobacteria bacterium]|tara:strand:+ start:1171 stop:2448 length:1278 start_codon:yes stop_codon:yes gene_type:complete
MEMTWMILALLAVMAILLLMLVKRQGEFNHLNSNDAIRAELQGHRKEISESGSQLRQELTNTVLNTVGELGKGQAKHLEGVESRVKTLAISTEERLDKLRDTVDKQLDALRKDNKKELSEMRKTVDERLQSTLEKRLSESFKLVQTQLKDVHEGLGEMQALATGVGDLSRVLTNVKLRGTWGEYQVEALLEQIFTPEQYQANVEIKAGSGKRVEFAIKMPGESGNHEKPLWLPIDSKFPIEDYERLMKASEEADDMRVQEASKALRKAFIVSAKDIKEKYIYPPNTTDFAIMFLPTEGLYAEAIRQPGLQQELLNKYHIVPAGPTIFSALLSSLNMGFRTLAIQKRSSEVWQTLAAVKTEFGKFGDILTRVRTQLETASRTIDEKVLVRTRVMQRKLKDVEELPEARSAEILPLPASERMEDLED